MGYAQILLNYKINDLASMRVWSNGSSTGYCLTNNQEWIVYVSQMQPNFTVNLSNHEQNVSFVISEWLNPWNGEYLVNQTLIPTTSKEMVFENPFYYYVNKSISAVLYLYDNKIATHQAQKNVVYSKR